MEQFPLKEIQKLVENLYTLDSWDIHIKVGRKDWDTLVINPTLDATSYSWERIPNFQVLSEEWSVFWHYIQHSNFKIPSSGVGSQNI